MKMFESQTSPFAARVYFFDKKRIRDLFSNLLIRYFRAAAVTDNGEENEDDPSDERFSEMRGSLTVFMALFCEKEQFEDEESAREYLQHMKSEGDQNVLDELTGWAVDMVHATLESNEFFLVEGSTPENLVNALQPFTHQVSGMDEGYEQ